MIKENYSGGKCFVYQYGLQSSSKGNIKNNKKSY